MPMTPKEMARLLEEHGFVLIRQNGSHRLYKHPEIGKITVVPFHCKDLKKGLEQKILKDAGIQRA